MASKLEKEYLSRVAGLGCIVCQNNGYEDSPAEIHHMRVGHGVADRAPYWETLPLCPIHHRTGDGTPKSGGELGFHAAASLSAEGDEGRKWEDRYGSERELLSQVHGQLATELLDRVQVDRHAHNQRLQRMEDLTPKIPAGAK